MKSESRESERLCSSTSMSHSTSAAAPVSKIDATIYLIRANLGPGCLNLPHAFAQTGWALGTVLMMLVAIQGIYCMWLLAYCKQLIDSAHVTSFMDVTSYALGWQGALIVESFLVIVQGGVCCVYVQLISTNVYTAMTSIGVELGLFSTTLLVALFLLRVWRRFWWHAGVLRREFYAD